MHFERWGVQLSCGTLQRACVFTILVFEGGGGVVDRSSFLWTRSVPRPWMKNGTPNKNMSKQEPQRVIQSSGLGIVGLQGPHVQYIIMVAFRCLAISGPSKS